MQATRNPTAESLDPCQVLVGLKVVLSAPYAALVGRAALGVGACFLRLKEAGGVATARSGHDVAAMEDLLLGPNGGLTVRLGERPHFEAADPVDAGSAAVLGPLVNLGRQGARSVLKHVGLG